MSHYRITPRPVRDDVYSSEFREKWCVVPRTANPVLCKDALAKAMRVPSTPALDQSSAPAASATGEAREPSSDAAQAAQSQAAPIAKLDGGTMTPRGISLSASRAISNLSREELKAVALQSVEALARDGRAPIPVRADFLSRLQRRVEAHLLKWDLAGKLAAGKEIP